MLVNEQINTIKDVKILSDRLKYVLIVTVHFLIQHYYVAGHGHNNCHICKDV